MVTCNLQEIKQLIAHYEQKYARTKASVQLLAASKGQSLEKIQTAWAQGQTEFGENYLQEALPKITQLPKANWHFIGRLQSNKTKKIAQHFQWVHSLSNLTIAQRLNEQRPPYLPVLNICIEINISGEKSKGGVTEEAAPELIESCLSLSRLKLRGLMTISPMDADFSTQRQIFRRLFQLRKKLNANGLQLDTLSMGMSQDMEAAIAEGATIVRIGTALFGPRS